MKKLTEQSLMEIAQRIREMREIVGYSPAQLAERTDVSEETYRIYESGKVDLPFSFLHKFGIAPPKLRCVQQAAPEKIRLSRAFHEFAGQSP